MWWPTWYFGKSRLPKSETGDLNSFALGTWVFGGLRTEIPENLEIFVEDEHQCIRCPKNQLQQLWFPRPRKPRIVFSEKFGRSTVWTGFRSEGEHTNPGKRKIIDRICYIGIKTKEQWDKVLTNGEMFCTRSTDASLNRVLINVYAPHLGITTKTPESNKRFCKNLSDTLNYFKGLYCRIIWGFNANLGCKQLIESPVGYHTTAFELQLPLWLPSYH